MHGSEQTATCISLAVLKIHTPGLTFLVNLSRFLIFPVSQFNIRSQIRLN
jgi:hypothetical protein